MPEQEPAIRRVISIRDEDAMSPAERCSAVTTLSSCERMEMLALMAAQESAFEAGADYFCEYLRLMQMWAGEQGRQFRDAYGGDARRLFTEKFISREGQLAERIEVMNEWLGRIGWRGAPLNAEELTQLILSGDSNGKGG